MTVRGERLRRLNWHGTFADYRIKRAANKILKGGENG
jgi:hypothetical protein